MIANAIVVGGSGAFLDMHNDFPALVARYTFIGGSVEDSF